MELRKNWQLISFCREDVQLKIYEVLFNFDFPCNLSRGEYIAVCIQEFQQKFLMFHCSVGCRCVGWRICLQMNPVNIEFVIANRFENIIIRKEQFGSKDICSSFCLVVVQTIKIGVLKCLAGVGMIPVKQCVSQFIS